MHDIEFFELMLPHLTSFLEVTKRCGFMSEGMKDPMPMGHPGFRIRGTETVKVLRTLKCLGFAI
jgi:hypothetical protein